MTVKFIKAALSLEFFLAYLAQIVLIKKLCSKHPPSVLNEDNNYPILIDIHMNNKKNHHSSILYKKLYVIYLDSY